MSKESSLTLQALIFLKDGVEPMRSIPVFLFVLALFATPAPACSLCGTLSRATSLYHELESADGVLYGKIGNAKPGVGVGKGTTDFDVLRVIKPEPTLPGGPVVVLHQFLPILDPKDPPRYVIFFRKGMAQPYTGRQLMTPAVLDFLGEMQKHRADPAALLIFAGKHLDHADPHIADEAFMVFAKADDKLIGQVAKKLSAEKLRKLIQMPDMEPERLSMYAYLLGACGDAKDLDTLRALLKDQRNFKAFEGILAGYVTMRPQEGWAYLHELLKNEKTPFLLRYATLRTMRFFYNASPEETGAEVMRGLGVAVERADVADIAITDLRTWKRWEHTKTILACYDKASHRSPIVKNSIVRYALACPHTEARELVERVRRQEPELVKYLQEDLK